MPARRRYVVTLTAEERTQLRGMVQTGREKAFRRRRAHILLQVDAGPWGPGRGDVETAELWQLHTLTVGRARRAFARQGLAASLVPPALDHPRRARRLDGAGEAELTKLACSPAPAGTSGWTLQLLADRLVALLVVDSIGRETVRVALQKTGCSLGKSAAGA